ncbi:hypothetical protein MRX96_050559 [Rhipicephalus microplus]
MFFVALLTVICIVADFIRTSLDSDLCAFETDAGIICVNRTLNSTVCPVASNGSRLPCVNITSNSSCRKELGMEATQSPEMKLEYTPIDNTKPPDYPLPASQNMLYLVGYSENLSMSEYPCVASTYMYYMWGAHYRELLLKNKKRVTIAVSRSCILYVEFRNCPAPAQAVTEHLAQADVTG